MKKGKTVLCITTGEIYASVKECASAMRLNCYSVYNVCEGRVKRHKGMEFCYLEDAPYRITDIAKGIKQKNEYNLRRELAAAKAVLDKTAAEHAAAQEKYNAILARIGQ